MSRTISIHSTERGHLRPRGARIVSMWYFSWILGLGLACSVGIINAMWIEYQLTGKAPDSD